MLVFDAEAGHAAFAVDANAYDPENYSRYGYLGVLQLGEAQTTTFALSDLVGDWTGVSARADDTFTVTSTSASTASITGTQTLSMTGEFGEGSFSVTDGGIFLGDGSSGVYETGYNAQTGYDYSVSMPNQDAYGAIYVLSPDKNYLAVAFLDDLCDPSLLFRLPDQLFSLWVRQ
jgi:hypothetical protein